MNAIRCSSSDKLTKEILVETKTWLSLISGLFSAGAYLPYIIAILRKDSTVRPNRASWFTWWVIDVSTVAALWAASSYGALPIFFAFSIGSTYILYLSIKRGEGGFEPLDLGCIATALVGVVLWLKSGNPTLAVVALMTSAIAATLPTIKKSWLNPESEDAVTWRLFATGGFFAILAIGDKSFVAVAPPVNVFFLQIMIVLPLGVHTFRSGRAGS